MTTSQFLVHLADNWGDMVSPLAGKYLDTVRESFRDTGEPASDAGFRNWLDSVTYGYLTPSDVHPHTGLDRAERVLFSVAPDRTLPNRVGTLTPVKDLWEGWVVNIRDNNGLTPGPTGDDVPADSLPVSYLLESFSGYATDQLHDDCTEPTDTDPTGPLPTLDAVRSVLTGLTVPTRWEDATVQGGETVQSWEVTSRVKLVRTDRTDGSWTFTVHVEPDRTGWDAEGVPTP